MRTSRLFCPSLAVGTLSLPPEESHHAVSALRLTAGSEVVLFDGAGTEGAGTIKHVERGRVIVDVSRVTQHPFDAALRLTLVVAMGKAHRQGFLIEKCTELGVGAICPLLTTRSVTRPGTSAVNKWSRRAIEASKQSGRSWIPEILPPCTLAEVLSDGARFAWMGFADTVGTPRPLAELLSSVDAGSEIVVFVGPEGGFTEEERRRFLECGAVSVSLAPTVLRTETAAMAVCAAVSMCCAARRLD